MMLASEYLRLLKAETKMTQFLVRKLMRGHFCETYTATGRPVSFCAMSGPELRKNEKWTEQAGGLFEAMWSYLDKTKSVQHEKRDWVQSHVDTMRHPSAGHRYWFLLEKVHGNLCVVAYVHFDCNNDVGMYIVHVLCQSSGWNATSALTAIAVEKAARNNIPMVFLNFTGAHLDKIYRRCGFVDPPAELAPVFNEFTDPVHNQVLVRFLESKTTVAKTAAKGMGLVKTRAIGPERVVVGYAAPAMSEDSDALLSAAPTAASSPADADLVIQGDLGGARRKRRRDSEPPETAAEAAAEAQEAGALAPPEAGAIVHAAKRAWRLMERLRALCAQGMQRVL